MLIVTVVALWYILTGIERATGLGLDAILHSGRTKGAGPEANSTGAENS